ncbi:LysR family transcriptional regulator substrate-binding protein [Leifsonia poae]|uniref:LysR family transcriptional regulator substrate-binding protein n=1 Tax=Leifsonia poae TaxID=110933 RepID=UPI001CC1AB2D|nr:LysR family transcriptional regulator substrate-binding protein [Leifsonia poae]
MASPFTIAFPLGVTVGKWTRVFEQRHPDAELRVVRVEPADQRSALATGEADMAFVREPFEAEGMHVIPLYEENVVVVMNHEHLLTLEKELNRADLTDEKELTGDWSETLFRRVAAGDGIAVLPQSIAKAFQRKDVTAMRLEDAAPSRVGLAWPRDSQHPMVDEFIGIVRGRSAHSSRNPEVAAGEAAQRQEAERRKVERQKAARQASAREAAAKRKKAGGQIRKRARRGGA